MCWKHPGLNVQLNAKDEVLKAAGIQAGVDVGAVEGRDAYGSLPVGVVLRRVSVCAAALGMCDRTSKSLDPRSRGE